jgi:hypothetical protein
MGVDIGVWRAREGCFQHPLPKIKWTAPKLRINSKGLRVLAYTALLMLLLVAGDVEPNPGPTEKSRIYYDNIFFCNSIYLALNCNYMYAKLCFVKQFSDTIKEFHQILPGDCNTVLQNEN